MFRSKSPKINRTNKRNFSNNIEYGKKKHMNNSNILSPTASLVNLIYIYLRNKIFKNRISKTKVKIYLKLLFCMRNIGLNQE